MILAAWTEDAVWSMPLEERHEILSHLMSLKNKAIHSTLRDLTRAHAELEKQIKVCFSAIR